MKNSITHELGYRHKYPAMNTKPSLANVCVPFVNVLRISYAFSIFDTKFQKVLIKNRSYTYFSVLNKITNPNKRSQYTVPTKFCQWYQTERYLSKGRLQEGSRHLLPLTYIFGISFLFSFKEYHFIYLSNTLKFVNNSTKPVILRSVFSLHIFPNLVKLKLFISQGGVSALNYINQKYI